MRITQKSILLFLVLSNVITLLLLHLFNVPKYIYAVFIITLLPIYILAFAYYQKSTPVNSPDPSNTKKCLACPKCGADNFTRCMIHTAWVRNGFDPNWNIWECPNCGTELTLSQKTKKTGMIASIIFFICFIGFGLFQFIDGFLILIPGYYIFSGILMGYAGELEIFTGTKERWW